MAAGKTSKSQSKRPAALTEKNKKSQASARKRKAMKRIGQAAQKRISKREYLRKMRADNPSFGRKVEPEFHCKHEALNTNSRGTDQLIYSCRGWWEK